MGGAVPGAQRLDPDQARCQVHVHANGVEDTGPLFIDFSTRKLRSKYNDTLQVNASKEVCTTFNCEGLKLMIVYQLIQ